MPQGVIGDFLFDVLESVSVSGVVIASVNTENDDWSTYCVRLAAADMMKVALKHINLADESSRLVSDNDPIVTNNLTAIVSGLLQ